MRIYTRKGDAGETGLLTGERVRKDDARLEVLGSIDELVAHLGVARSVAANEAVEPALAAIQAELYLLMADVAAARDDAGAAAPDSRLPTGAVEHLERLIDGYEAGLPPLRDFVMPGERQASAVLHVARTVCRRAERRAATLGRSVALSPDVSAYLNRLSDLLFVMSRTVDHDAGAADRTLKQAT